MKVKCPTCAKEVEWKDSEKNKPFCSDRCKLIDLGEWAAERHAIPGKSVEEELMSEELKQFNSDQLH